MKQFFFGFLSLILLSGVAVAAIGGWGAHAYLSAGPLPQKRLVLIERGQGVSAIAETLVQEGVIYNAMLFKVAARFEDSLKAGEYEFDAHISMAGVLDKLEDGEVFDRKITLIEGLTSYQMVSRLNERDDFAGPLITAIPPEGSLLPDTYQFVTGETRQDKIDQMQSAMIKAVNELWKTRQANLPFKTKKEALILASIIEKETSVVDERERVAGVFVNRLRKGMLLQTDPTVIYAITKGRIQEEGKGPLGRRLLRKDLKFDSPYNTYKYAGLPPAPIANPGRASIAAALNPESHDYIFFVANGTGGHAFSKTLKEHNASVRKWRQIRSQK